MKEIAIIGPTASGKSALAIELATRGGAYILSIDSLSVYKEIDIVSAKPSKEELATVPHFGIDILYPNEHFSIERFIRIYEEAKDAARKANKHLIIVGGTLFYLKMLLTGLSPLPPIEQKIVDRVDMMLEDLEQAFHTVEKIDPAFARKITPNDRYRIEKALLIYYATNMPPSHYFQLHPPKPIINDIPIYALQIDRQELRKRVIKRTTQMLRQGLIEEIYSLTKRYGRNPNPMKAIGIVETLDYLDGKISLTQLHEQIVNHTMQLAKRQRTFMRTQFHNIIAITPQQKEQIMQELRQA